MTTFPPPAEELRILDHELARLDARRAQLLHRRAWLLGALRAQAAGPTPPRPPFAAPPHAQPTPGTPPNVQNVLLTLGGILLTIAAIAFTVVSWGHLGIGGRSAVLGAVTVAALGVPALLLRRGLRSTAETVAALGLALMVLDAYALHRVALPEADAVGYAAAASAVLAGLWVAYGLVMSDLRLPLPVAVAAAQLPLLLWGLADGAGPRTLIAVLLVTAAGDTFVALWARPLPVRVVAFAGAVALGGWGTASAAGLSVTAQGPDAAARAGVLLLLATAIALHAAWRAGRADLSTWCGALAGLSGVAAVGGVLRTVLDPSWLVPGYLLCGIAVLALALTALPRPLRPGLVCAAGAVTGAALLWALPTAAMSLLEPTTWLGQVWSGSPELTHAEVAGVPGLAVPVTLLTVAGTLLAAHRLIPPGPAWRTPAACGALALLWSSATTLPASLQLPYAAGLSLHLTLAALALAAAVRLSGTAQSGTALACGLASTLTASCLALATRPATFAVFGVLLAAYAGAAWLYAEGARRAVPACVAVGYATALAVAVPAALELPAHGIALTVLAVPAATALLGARLTGRAAGLPVELSGAAAAALAIGLAGLDAPMLALVLALVGVIAAGTALRPERRQVMYVSGALFVAASWVRLAAWDIGSPEAYTLPVTVPALFIGALRRRRAPETSSWTAYAPGLAATLLPSLLAAWGDTHWLRPLLLGAAALLLTLAGSHHRLQAPLALGSAVLALDALHELAPYVVQVVGALPRWLPMALAGLLLLAVGATYEQRLRDARRMRDVLGRMH
ncbi:SCO7613 C-terminal domain-containing membrane protein [Streptomyces sp. NBC_01304]|uniref:SCO7613 C-terminal domain-containing membrane protein n=1 Tax=Streptomyces sp. NBC_01304 TaxID=2903818 RepID=UPI002E0D4799|nr:hypothetical protein OG430_39300 [Streptomyces sp. NBC_01304]